MQSGKRQPELQSVNQSAGGRVLVLQEEGGRSEPSPHTTVTQTEGEGPGQQVQRRDGDRVENNRPKDGERKRTGGGEMREQKKRRI